MSIFSAIASLFSSEPAWKGNDINAAEKEINAIHDFDGLLRVIKEAPSSAVAALAASKCLALAAMCKRKGETENEKVCLMAFCMAFKARNDDQFHNLCLEVASKLGLLDDLMEIIKSK